MYLPGSLNSTSDVSLTCQDPWQLGGAPQRCYNLWDQESFQHPQGPGCRNLVVVVVVTAVSDSVRFAKRQGGRLEEVVAEVQAGCLSGRGVLYEFAVTAEGVLVLEVVAAAEGVFVVVVVALVVGVLAAELDDVAHQIEHSAGGLAGGWSVAVTQSLKKGMRRMVEK